MKITTHPFPESTAASPIGGAVDMGVTSEVRPPFHLGLCPVALANRMSGTVKIDGRSYRPWDFCQWSGPMPSDAFLKEASFQLARRLSRGRDRFGDTRLGFGGDHASIPDTQDARNNTLVRNLRRFLAIDGRVLAELTLGEVEAVLRKPMPRLMQMLGDLEARIAERDCTFSANLSALVGKRVRRTRVAAAQARGAITPTADSLPKAVFALHTRATTTTLPGHADPAILASGALSEAAVGAEVVRPSMARRSLRDLGRTVALAAATHASVSVAAENAAHAEAHSPKEPMAVEIPLKRTLSRALNLMPGERLTAEFVGSGALRLSRG